MRGWKGCSVSLLPKLFPAPMSCNLRVYLITGRDFGLPLPHFLPLLPPLNVEIVLNPSLFLRHFTCASQFCAFAQVLTTSGVNLCLFVQCEMSFPSEMAHVAGGKEDWEDLAFLRQARIALKTLHKTTSSMKDFELLLAITVQSL